MKLRETRFSNRDEYYEFKRLLAEKGLSNDEEVNVKSRHFKSVIEHVKRMRKRKGGRSEKSRASRKNR